MILLVKLLIAHLIGDFVLQPNSWIEDKEAKKGKSIKLYYHVLIHTVLTGLILLDYTLLPIALIIGGTHFVIDLCKLSMQNQANKRMVFTADQLAHLLIILILSNYYEPILHTIQMDGAKNQLYLIVLAVLLLVPVSSKTIIILISKWSPKIGDGEEDSLKDAGQYIGILERLFVFGFVILGQIQAVGFLLAAKSVFRFGDLKDPTDRKLTEYILIGTLLSFGIAILIGYTYLYLDKNIK